MTYNLDMYLVVQCLIWLWVMGYGMNPLDMPFGAQGYMMPLLPPQREFPRDREYGREVSSSVGDVSSMKSKSKLIPQSENADHHHHRQRTIRSSPEPPTLPPSKRKSDHHYHDYDYDHDHHNHHHHRSESSSKPSSETASTTITMTTSNKKSKASVFSCINLPKQEAINADKK